MTKTISVADARKRFAEITDEVLHQGNEYIILKHGKEVAKLVAPSAVTKISEGFEEWLDEATVDFHDDLQALASR